MQLLLALDVGLAVMAFVGSYFSFKALQAFRKDVMESVFGFVAVAFILVGFESVLEAVVDVFGIELETVLLFHVTLIVCSGLIMSGLILFIRWAGETTAQRT
ncbi:MAG: hypothetical protein OK452_08280 [Thaumarchaeota archaeon]|nr:hypothetical protein [Nitrososphaerota archaeon]